MTELPIVAAVKTLHGVHAGSFPYAELLLHARPQAPARLLAVDQLHVDGAGVRGRLSLLLHVTVLLACVYLIAALDNVCVCVPV